MRYALFLVALLSPAVSPAQELDGRRIVVEGKAVPAPVPVVLDYDGDVPEKSIVVRHAETGSESRASIRSGVFTFLASAPGEHTVKTLRTRKKPTVTVHQRPDEEALEVRIHGELLTVFHYGADLRKPYLWPLTAEGGVHITRDWPLGEADKTKDHPHHTSMWTAHGDLNGTDYWEYGERTGWQRVEDIKWTSGDAYGRIGVRILWLDKNEEPVITEFRDYTFYDTPPDARLFDITVRFMAEYGEVKFGDTKEGGIIGLRIADAIRERGGTGRITNSAGGVGADACWGKPAAWCDYSGTFKRYGERGIAVFDHPASFRHPTHWHVRNYGLMGANPFGYSHFYDGKKNGDHLLKSGEKMAFRYRIYIHSGNAEQAGVAETYAAFAEPPEAHWVN